MHYSRRIGLRNGFHVTIASNHAYDSPVAVDDDILSDHHSPNPRKVEMMHLQGSILKPGIIAHHDEEIRLRFVVVHIHLLGQAFIAYQHTNTCLPGNDQVLRSAGNHVVVSARVEERENR